MPTTPPPFDFDRNPLTLHATAHHAFDAYNTGGPPERAGLTWDGKPVPPFERLDPSVTHKWHAGASAAALLGAEFVIALVEVGQYDPAKLRAAVEAALSCPPYVAPSPP